MIRYLSCLSFWCRKPCRRPTEKTPWQLYLYWSRRSITEPTEILTHTLVVTEALIDDPELVLESCSKMRDGEKASVFPPQSGSDYKLSYGRGMTWMRMFPLAKESSQRGTLVWAMSRQYSQQRRGVGLAWGDVGETPQYPSQSTPSAAQTPLLLL